MCAVDGSGVAALTLPHVVNKYFDVFFSTVHVFIYFFEMLLVCGFRKAVLSVWCLYQVCLYVISTADKLPVHSVGSQQGSDSTDSTVCVCVLQSA